MLSPLAILILVLAALLPTGWIIGEVQNHAVLRRTCGVGSFVIALLVAIAVGSLQRLNYNTHYGSAAKQLFEETVLALEAGNDEAVLREYKALLESYRPTYENRGNFDELTTDTAARIADSRDSNGR